jgi:hypothetical protein
VSFRPMAVESEPEPSRDADAADPHATRVSERFVLPADALPSDRPPPTTSGITATKETARMAVPESIKLLRTAVPTPQAFQPQEPPGGILEKMARMQEAEPTPPVVAPMPSRPKRRSRARVVALTFVVLALLSVLGAAAFRIRAGHWPGPTALTGSR